MQDSASFWADIKNLEEQLAKSPDSFCFARLSAVYLKVGLIEDALHVARQGVMKHPCYLSGQRALSLACHAKGLNDEALIALKLVTEALPEDIQSQKLLGRLFVEAGNEDAACRAFRTALEFAPDDVECLIELESLERPAVDTDFALEPDEDDDEVIEDLEILEEDQSTPKYEFHEAPVEPDRLTGPYQDPLSTGTLAELYVTQGFVHKALDIYRAILVDNPSDRVIAERVVELEALENVPSEYDSKIYDTFEEEAEDEPAFGISSNACFQQTEFMALPEYGVVPALESQQACADISGYESSSALLHPQGGANNTLSTLDRWLENIGRIKSCR